ncbi:Six-hairpin glycosidase-like protein [Pleurotus pulmonarius]
MDTLFGILLLLACIGASPIDRRPVVERFNPVRTFSNPTTPLQVGNGNFAFGSDITGLQTFLPFATMSSWGWKNDSLPPGKTVEDVENYRGVSWDNHGRLVQYDFNGGDPDIEQWLISNPNRVNLGRIGLVFRTPDGRNVNTSEEDLTDKRQELDLWSGTLTSAFTWEGERVIVTTIASQESDNVGIRVESSLLRTGRLNLFVDFPWNDGKAKFSAPFVGRWDVPANHTTELSTRSNLDEDQPVIRHTMGASTFFTSFGGDTFEITRDSESTHRYTVKPLEPAASFTLTVAFRPVESSTPLPSFPETHKVASATWNEFWRNGGFVDVLTGSTDPRAAELQRRIILSRYLLRVNEAGDTPPQESGLVNNGWYGKFHMEMYFWHSAHWALWNDWDLLRRSSDVYSRFLPSSIRRAQVQQNWDAGARWPKMTDPSGRSAPGQINNLLIWQQVHPIVFAEYEYRAFPTREILEKWKNIVKETANWMAEFAWFNESTGVYDIGPPMYVVSEDTSPNATRNAAFELAYWDLGLGLASSWLDRLGEEVPASWTSVKENLAALPMENGLYSVYDGIEGNFWNDPAFTNDHPALVGLHGWLPQTKNLDVKVAATTAEEVWSHWNISNCWGWDFPMLAMSAARNGQTNKAVEWLLHPLFQFDDAGMPIGGLFWQEDGMGVGVKTRQDSRETGGM